MEELLHLGFVDHTKVQGMQDGQNTGSIAKKGIAEEAGTTIIIADDHPLFRAALRQVLEGSVVAPAPPLKLLEAKTVDEVHDLLAHDADIDLILLDLHIPGAHGFSGLANLRGCYPDVPVAMISGSDALHIRQRAAELGASGFISKATESEQLSQAISGLLAGDNWFPRLEHHSPSALDAETAELVERVASLTPHQFRVYTMITQGMLNKQIAYELGISEPTVKSHVTAILRKLGVRKRTEVIIIANALDVETPDHDV